MSPGILSSQHTCSPRALEQSKPTLSNALRRSLHNTHLHIPQVPTSRTSTHNRACPSPTGYYHQRKPRIPSFCTSPCSFVLGLTGTKFNRFDLFVNAGTRMTSSGAINIAALEHAAARITSQTQSANPPNNHMPPPAAPATRVAGPLSSEAQPPPRKRTKRKLTKVEDDEPRCPIPTEELMKLDILELRKVAQEYSKGAMSDEDEQYFIALHQQQEKEQAIKAIERGLSLSMVFALLGRRIAIKEANRWNRFLQTDQARLIFQQSGLGVKDKSVMKQLLAAYALLSKDEKNALLKVPGPNNPSLKDIDNEATPNGNQSHVGGTHTDNVSGPRNTMSVNASMVRGTLSAQIRYNQAQKAVNTWLDEAVHIAKTCSCEIVFFAVSNHLAAHSFQFVRCTPGALASEQAMSALNGNNRYPARLQAFITGQEVGQVAAAQKTGVKPNSVQDL
ncbi:hypothetical protein PCASD_14821 [Puccinia coronata f. sp. avenae]|uniref:Uncharacterized protein n=1 Tax=Puccinia coronata f. sp. avenae TaxID=200324 RepID=A0A2N5TCH1_9BASI|nr:hypothetical protein PCASD_14821 [Puccinia coronata f. sp. avenae]